MSSQRKCWVDLPCITYVLCTEWVLVNELGRWWGSKGCLPPVGFQKPTLREYCELPTLFRGVEHYSTSHKDPWQVSKMTGICPCLKSSWVYSEKVKLSPGKPRVDVVTKWSYLQQSITVLRVIVSFSIEIKNLREAVNQVVWALISELVSVFPHHSLLCDHAKIIWRPWD